MIHADLSDTEVVDEWNRRCEVARARKRRLLHVAWAWIGVMILLWGLSMLLSPEANLVIRLALGFIFGTGFWALFVASINSEKVLRCPRCGKSPQGPGTFTRNVAELEACDWCLAHFRTLMLPNSTFKRDARQATRPLM